MNIIKSELELTILMPCLNEAETLETCIRKAQTFLEKNNIAGEVLIADNGSTDGSQAIAIKNGARVVNITQKGYGSALIGGNEAALGKYVIMGDADDSYDFLDLMPFVEKLREGYQLVMGNRFRGGIKKGAMPPLHRYLGNPVLSFIGRIFYPSKIKDFHCGLRGYDRIAIQNLHLRTTGMEYASEMVVQSTLNHLKMIEVPTTLSPDGRTRAPHLRSFRDGWRHLKFLLMYSPNWLFFYPGILFITIGLIMSSILFFGPITIGQLNFDIHTLLYSSAFIIMGVNICIFSIFTKIYAANSNFIPASNSINRISKLTTEKGLIVGLILFFVGLGFTVYAVDLWSISSFGNLDPRIVMRVSIPSITSIIIGVQIIFSSFFIGILNIKYKNDQNNENI